MTWTAPSNRTTGELITASIWNTEVIGNILHLADLLKHPTHFYANSQHPDSSYTLATVANRNGHLVLVFADSGTPSALFRGRLSPYYASGGLTVEIEWAADTATTGTVQWSVSIERHQLDVTDWDSGSFAAANPSSADTTGSAAGEPVVSTVTFTDGADMDSLAAGESYRILVQRTGGTMTGDAHVGRVSVQET